VIAPAGSARARDAMAAAARTKSRLITVSSVR
jgi:hypothetical protein